MDYRGVLALTMLGAAAVAGASTSSCSAADPSTVNFSERPRGQTGDLTSGGVNPTDGGGSSSGEAGTEAGTDGGSSGLPLTAFTGAKAFNAAGAPVGDSQNGAHPNGGNPAGVNCMDCHSAAGGANAKWGIAGTIYTSAAGTTPLKGAEVRVVDAAGKELALVYSDDKGNFWADTIVGGVPGGAKVGARNATVTKLMSTALTTQDASCQKAGCHVAGSQGRVYLQ
ncbi:hypothetical protein BH11MYX4_BH11MYX4_31110 [soil metagenome]